MCECFVYVYVCIRPIWYYVTPYVYAVEYNKYYHHFMLPTGNSQITLLKYGLQLVTRLSG